MPQDVDGWDKPGQAGFFSATLSRSRRKISLLGAEGKRQFARASAAPAGSREMNAQNSLFSGNFACANSRRVAGVPGAG
jgi:hypothetical protein